MANKWLRVYTIVSTIVTVFVLTVTILLAVGLYRGSKAKERFIQQHFSASFNAPVEDSTGGIRVLQITDINKEQALQFTNEFEQLFIQNDDKLTKPVSVEEKDGYVFMEFPETISYHDFGYWVNYMVYSEKPPVRHRAVGWYQTGRITNLSDSLGLSNTILMMFVPDSDEEYDTFYFVNQDGTCFKQDFAWPEHLFVLKDRIREYEECPR